MKSAKIKWRRTSRSSGACALGGRMPMAITCRRSDGHGGRATDMKLAVSVTLAGVLLLLAASLAVAADQPREKVPRVGYLSPGSPSDPVRARRFEAFRQSLRELGYVEGQNVAIESRWAQGN